MKKRIMATVLAGLMALSLAACGGSSSGSSAAPADEKTESAAPAEGQEAPAEAASGEQTHIYVLTASEDHGWTGSVATFAKAKVEEVNAEGTYSADISEQLGGIMSVTYSPSMIKTAIQDMEDYLAGKDVEQDHVIACEIVTGENVDNYEAFN